MDTPPPIAPTRSGGNEPVPPRLEDPKVVLVVDDDPNLRDSLRRTLSVLKARVLDAGSAKEALEVLGHFKVDLLIADYMMPSINGIELVRRARAQRPEIRTLMMTGFATTQVILRSLNEAHVDHFVEKPWQPEHLLRLAGSLLRLRDGKYAPRVIVGLELPDESDRLCAALERAAMAFRRASSMDELIRLLSSEGNIVLITELEGLVFRGMDLLRGMGAREIPRRPVILTSSVVTEESLVGAARLGTRHVVLRPWTDETLLSRIQELLLSAE